MASIDLFPRPEKLQTFPPSPILDSQELHVLAVDDSIIDRKVIERLLKISSCKVTAVDSGRRALQLLGLDGNNNSVGIDGLKVNLIITDYWMPGMTGYELLKKIKESSTFREIPVVIMSSENVLTRINRCLEEGAEEFLVKPVQLSDVKRLKDYIIREEFEGDEKKRSNNKRKLIQNSSTDLHLSSDSSPPLEASISSSSDLSDLSSSSSSSSSELSDSSSPSSDSSPPSPDLTPPSSLESPSRRFRQTNEYESL